MKEKNSHWVSVLNRGTIPLFRKTEWPTPRVAARERGQLLVPSRKCDTGVTSSQLVLSPGGLKIRFSPKTECVQNTKIHFRCPDDESRPAIHSGTCVRTTVTPFEPSFLAPLKSTSGLLAHLNCRHTKAQVIAPVARRVTVAVG